MDIIDRKHMNEQDQASVLLIEVLTTKIQTLTQKCRNPLDEEEAAKWELIKRSHQLALECRRMYGRTRNERADDIALLELQELGYAFERIGRTVHITLPLLLPKRGGDCSFLTDPLNQLLSICARDFERYEECVILFRHVYGEKKRRVDVRDHDNIESKKILDILDRFLLLSDSGCYISNIQTTEFGRSDKTVITILPGRLDLPRLERAVME